MTTETTATTPEERRAEMIAEVKGELATRSLYDLLGGADGTRRIVDAFYDVMDADDRYGPIRRMHKADLSPMRVSLFEYLSGWFGGPALYVERRGTPCMTGPHAPYAIGPEARDLWVDCMERALVDAQVPEKYRVVLGPAFERMARMIQNRE